VHFILNFSITFFHYNRASKQNRVLILSMHLAQYCMYELFDTLTLLSNGYMVYHGPAGDTALQYFKNLGMHTCVYVCVSMYVTRL